MSPFLWIVVAVLLLYFALRVVQLKRSSLPFVVAYPLFVTVLLGGAVAVFVAANWVAVSLGLERGVSLAVVFGSTAVSVILLWLVARRLIG